MTRIMVWNVKNFTLNKISPTRQFVYDVWGQKLKNNVLPAATSTLHYVGGATHYWASNVQSRFRHVPANQPYFDFFPLVAWAAAQADGAQRAGVTGAAFKQTFYQQAQRVFQAQAPGASPQIRGAFFGVNHAGSVADVLLRIFQTFQTRCVVPAQCPDFSILVNLCQQCVDYENDTTPTKPTPAVFLDALTHRLQLRFLSMGSASPQQPIFEQIIENVIAAGDGTTHYLPEILVVLEVLSETAVGRYDTIDGEGAVAALELLAALRVVNPNYCLVPPVRLSNQAADLEGIAVYYDASQLCFAGPQKWTANQAQALGNAAAAQNYAPVWQPSAYGAPPAAPATGAVAGFALPNRQVTIAGAPYNEYQLAGRCVFPTPRARAVRQFMRPGDRPPLLTYFQEIGGAGRTIKVCAMHATQGGGGPGMGAPNAPRAVDELRNIRELTALAANEVGVIVGDFNVQLLDLADRAAAYGNLTGAGGAGAAGYTLVFDDTQAIQPSFVGTTVIPFPQARGAFPDFGYLKTFGPMAAPQPESLDNILIKSGAGAAAFSHALVLNRVVGVDFAEAASSAVAGPYRYGYGTASIDRKESSCGSVMQETMEKILAGSGTAGAKNMQLNTVQNYGKIQGASDHMALVVDI